MDETEIELASLIPNESRSALRSQERRARHGSSSHNVSIAGRPCVTELFGGWYHNRPTRDVIVVPGERRMGQ